MAEEHEGKKPKEFHIKIDRVEYQVEQEELTVPS